MSRPLSISIFFPFLNDWGTVGSLVSLAIATVRQLADDWEVIIVNDGSNSKDREALQMVADVVNATMKQCNNETMRKKRLRIIDHPKNKGYGGALISGFTAATKDLIFYTDCDAQYDPRELGVLYEAMMSSFAPPSPKWLRRPSKATADKVGMVNGYKIKRNDPLHRVIAGRLYHHIVKFAFGLPLRDTDCDFRLIRREVFEKVKLYETTGTICTELVKKIDHFGYKIVEVPVHHFWRTSGKSQFFNFNRLYKTAVNLLKLWWKLAVLKNYYT